MKMTGTFMDRYCVGLNVYGKRAYDLLHFMLSPGSSENADLTKTMRVVHPNARIQGFTPFRSYFNFTDIGSIDRMLHRYNANVDADGQVSIVCLYRPLSKPIQMTAALHDIVMKDVSKNIGKFVKFIQCFMRYNCIPVEEQELTPVEMKLYTGDTITTTMNELNGFKMLLANQKCIKKVVNKFGQDLVDDLTGAPLSFLEAEQNKVLKNEYGRVVNAAAESLGLMIGSLQSAILPDVYMGNKIKTMTDDFAVFFDKHFKDFFSKYFPDLSIVEIKKTVLASFMIYY
jgi:hypothetical protein